MISRACTAVLLVCLACSLNSTTGPEFTDADADVRIMFIGNSLTYTHDVPGLVRAIALRQGRSLATASVTAPDYSLDDHWNRGVANEIRRLRPDIVVMQQGPSSLPASREHLIYWSRVLAEVIREVGGEAALYMVWPDVARRFAFPDVEISYAAAAAEVDGVLLPVGTTWLKAWEQDEELPLYGNDGLHASYLGALAAAYTIYAALFDVAPSTLPALDGRVSDVRVELLRDAVAASLQKWRP